MNQPRSFLFLFLAFVCALVFFFYSVPDDKGPDPFVAMHDEMNW